MDYGSIFSSIRADLPVPQILSPSSVRREASALSEDIIESWQQLNNIVQRHEAKIHKRWQKRTRTQRSKLLLTVWPTMAKGHRPDCDRYMIQRSHPSSTNIQDSEAFRWPHINQDDLSDTRKMLLLIKTRARNPPHVFSSADLDMMHFAFTSQVVVPAFLNEYTMYFVGRNTPTSYGQLVSWDDDPDAFEQMYSGHGMNPGEGLEVLKTQQRLYKFLLECCLLLLQDMSKDTITGPGTPILPEPSLAHGRLTEYDFLTTMTAEAPYKAPAYMDLDRVESLLGSTITKAQDYFWNIREDPVFFASELVEASEHCQEMLKDSRAKSHPLLEPARESIFRRHYLRQFLAKSIIRPNMWMYVHSHAGRVRDLYKRYSPKDLSLDRLLPADLFDAILDFRYCLQRLLDDTLSLLKVVATSSPPMRRYFARVSPALDEINKVQVEQKPGVHFKKSQERLMWLLKTLWENNRDLFLIRSTTIVDELGRLLEQDRSLQEMISPYLADMLSELAIITQCIQQVQSFFPWAKSIGIQLDEREESLSEQHLRAMQPTTSWFHALDGLLEPHLLDLAQKASGRVDYPAGKRPTSENVAKCQAAEANLDAFWLAVDRRIQELDVFSRNVFVTNILKEERSLQRTADWTAGEIDVTNPAQEVSLSTPISDLYLDLRLKTESTLADSHDVRSQVRSKPKTRAVVQAQPEELLDNPINDDKGEKIYVSSRSIKALRTIFHNPSSTHAPGELPWIDFIHIMTDAGFIAEKLYGSAWNFKPPAGSSFTRSIQFHEPHPIKKLAYYVAREYGRRLWRAYGWHLESFQVMQ